MSAEHFSLAIVGAVVLLFLLYLGFLGVALLQWRHHGAWRWHVEDLTEAQHTGDWSKLGHSCTCFWCGVVNGALDKVQR